MKFSTIYASAVIGTVFVTFAFLIPGTRAITCHVCNNIDDDYCGIDDFSIYKKLPLFFKESGCRYCGKSIAFGAIVSRKCLSTCSETDGSVPGLVQKCCSTDSCNGADRLAWSSGVMTFVLVMAGSTLLTLWNSIRPM